MVISLAPPQVVDMVAKVSHQRILKMKPLTVSAWFGFVRDNSVQNPVAHPEKESREMSPFQ